MTNRDNHREACIEAMARANHKAYDRLGPDQQRRLRKTAAKYLDALDPIAFVLPLEPTHAMNRAGENCYCDPFAIYEAMSCAGRLTNPPETKP